MKFKEFLILIGFLIFLIFVVQNTKAFSVKFLFWTFSMSQALWLILTFILGISLGWILTLRTKKKPDDSQNEEED